MTLHAVIAKVVAFTSIALANIIFITGAFLFTSKKHHGE
jgi:hypothetical protein